MGPGFQSVKRDIFAWIGALVACTAGGLLCQWLHTPLPWMIGPLFVMATLSLAGVRAIAPPGGRQTGQVIIATALGLYFTPSVAREVLLHGDVLIAAALLAIGLACGGAYFVARYAYIDSATAFFASVPGGAAEMAVLGERFGGKVDRIVVAQSLRILMVVVVVPFAMTLLDVHGVDPYEPVRMPVRIEGLAILLAISGVASLVFARLKLPNAFMLGSLFATIALTVSEIQLSSMPTLLSNAGQLLIGCTLGSRFDRTFMRSARRFVVVVCLSVVFAMILSALLGAGLAMFASLAVPSMVLATAPGGIAEMCITAKVLQLGVPLVTAAHVTRVVVLVTMTGPMFRFVARRQAMRKQ
jgi:membrane AbrB-like protein